jgi:7-cyano-7-deazaguanine synthase
MQRKAFVCLSGGLDSTVTLYQACEDFSGFVEAISFDYGQRHSKEMEYARKTCQSLGIAHRIVGLRGLLDGDGVMLTDASVAVPDISYADIKGVSPTYVPFRNGTMLSVMAALAQKYVTAEIDKAVADAKSISTVPPDFIKERAVNHARDLCAVYAGQHRDDGLNWAYPDCTMEFLGAMANALYVGTYFTVRLVTPFVFSDKAGIVTAGARLGVPFADTWSCYKGENLHCGTCPTCLSRKEAFKLSGVVDPTEYKQ